MILITHLTIWVKPARGLPGRLDLRGWLTNISTSTFAEELFYADGPGTALYNGNISSIRWKDNSQSTKRGYKFSYDTANRLTSGAYGEGDALSSNANRYTETMTYDANGNITTLKRYGKTASGYSLMDNLTISYTGNQPTSVSESASDYNVSNSFEYKKANGSGYKFNANGSLIADKSRGIAYITYDLNNNPKQIYFTNGSVTKYVYSASGQKLRAVHYTAKPNITRTWGEKPAELTVAQILQADSTDYLLGGSLTMKNGRIDKFLFGGGYAQASVASSTTDNFAFYYYNQDHLGNIREVVDASGAVKQVTNYYPFGAPYADTAGSTNPDFQPYKYNGKELDKMHGLNTYDYGARQHDPILARWDRIDPLCEKYYSVSPYVYCGDNPIKYVDLHGDSLSLDGEKRALEEFIGVMNKYGTGEYKMNNGQVVHDLQGKTPNAYDEVFDDAINSSVNITMKVVCGDDNIDIADWESKTVDITDVQKMNGGDDFFTPGSILGHEIKEQTILQTMGQNEFSQRDVFNAHKKASNAESKMTGGSYKIHEITGRQIENSIIKMIGTSLTGGKNKEKIINLK